MSDNGYGMAFQDVVAGSGIITLDKRDTDDTRRLCCACTL